MHSAQLTQNVRQLVAQSFACLGIVEPTDMRETILIRDGSYCGRRFEADAASAVWFVEENQVKVYRADGTIARIIAPDEVLVPARAAA